MAKGENNLIRFFSRIVSSLSSVNWWMGLGRFGDERGLFRELISLLGNGKRTAGQRWVFLT